MRFVYAWLPVVLLEATVIFLSSRPGSSIHMPFPRVDKVLHFGEYAALGFFVFRALRLSGGGSREALAATLSLVALLGLGDEALQSRIPGRDSSIHDWFADVLGGCAGIWIAKRVERKLPRWFYFGDDRLDTPVRTPADGEG